MGKIKKNDNLIIKDLMSSYQSRDLGLNDLSLTRNEIRSKDSESK